MFRRLFLLAACSILTAVAAHAADRTPRIRDAWTTEEACGAPACVYYDTNSQSLFVSQVSGVGDEKDGIGCLSRFDLDGRLLTARWIDGLNAPKGICGDQKSLWVSDIDVILQIDLQQREILKSIRVPGARFLTDVACGPDGAVYVADMLTSRIHQVQAGKLSTFAEGDILESPNGLAIDGGSLIVAAWGRTTDYTTATPGHLYALDLKTRKKSLITRSPVGNLHGLELDGRGGYLVTDFMDGRLLHVTKAGSVAVLMQCPRGASDPAFLPDLDLLVLPHLIKNRITGYAVSRNLP